MIDTNLLHEYDKAMLELNIAENQFRYADVNFVDASIYKYNYALEKTKVLRKKLKETY